MPVFAPVRPPENPAAVIADHVVVTAVAAVVVPAGGGQCELPSNVLVHLVLQVE